MVVLVDRQLVDEKSLHCANSGFPRCFSTKNIHLPSAPIQDLAQKINEKPTIVGEFESGKAVPNPQVLGKMERVLGVKLRGKVRSISLMSSIEAEPILPGYRRAAGTTGR